MTRQPDNLFLTGSSSSKDEYIRMISDTAKAVTEAFPDGTAYSGKSPQELREIIGKNEILPEHGEGWNAVLSSIRTDILPNLLRTSSPFYAAHLHSPALLETVASELIISTFNQSMDSWDQSPAATETEVLVTEKLCSMFGYGRNSGGIFTSGGSQSNMTAIVMARDWFCSEVIGRDVRKYGLPENFTRLRMYTSEISHFSMEKTAQVMGLGCGCIVKVPVDSRKRIDTDKLEALIEKDISEGNIPFLAVATAGTTDFGSIDPMDRMADICSRRNIWLHADAAYGSGAVLSDKYRKRISGIERCDSITVDFHKMFLMPISCSAVLAKDGRDFGTFTIHADYLNRTEDEEDGYTNLVDKSLQTTRRFDALKVWTAFRTRGKDGWSRIIGTSMDNAAWLYARLNQDGSFETAAEPELSSVVFRHTASADPDMTNRRIRRELMHSHGITIGQTSDGGHVFLKFTLLNPETTRSDLERIVGFIKSIGEENSGDGTDVRRR